MLRTVLIALAAAAAAALARAEPPERVALLIGNGAYAHVPDLANPPRDTADLAAVLDGLGFAVTRVGDADFRALRLALKAFEDRAAGAEVALVYYAGHGIEIEGRNFMIPVDARLADARDVEFETVPLELFQRAADPARRMSLVILDACRNNPFLAQMAGRSRSVSRGLALVEPVGSNRLVAYAAKEGTVADDGEGENSPYAEALVAALQEPGLEIGKLFRRVRDRVYRATGGRQEPALYGSLSERDFYFLPPEEGEAAVSVEAAFWKSIEDSEDPRDFEDFLARFPESPFRGLAERRLARLSAGSADETAAPGTRGTAPEAGAPFSVTPEVIREVQARLNALGFDAGPVDGIMGARTAAALRAWQRAAGVPADGELGAAAHARLMSVPPAGRTQAATATDAAPEPVRPDWPLGKWCEADWAFGDRRCLIVFEPDGGATTVTLLRDGRPHARGCLSRDGQGGFLVRTGLRPAECDGPAEGREGLALVIDGEAIELDGRRYLRGR